MHPFEQERPRSLQSMPTAPPDFFRRSGSVAAGRRYLSSSMRSYGCEYIEYAVPICHCANAEQCSCPDRHDPGVITIAACSGSGTQVRRRRVVCASVISGTRRRYGMIHPCTVRSGEQRFRSLASAPSGRLQLRAMRRRFRRLRRGRSSVCLAPACLSARRKNFRHLLCFGRRLGDPVELRVPAMVYVSNNEPTYLK